MERYPVLSLNGLKLCKFVSRSDLVLIYRKTFSCFAWGIAQLSRDTLAEMAKAHGKDKNYTKTWATGRERDG